MTDDDDELIAAEETNEMGGAASAIETLILSEVRGLRQDVRNALTGLARAETNLEHGEGHLKRLDCEVKALTDHVATCQTVEGCEAKAAELVEMLTSGRDRKLVTYMAWFAGLAAFAALAQAFGGPLFAALKRALGG